MFNKQKASGMSILRVFPTNRSVKESFAKNKNSFLTKSLTIGEFEKKVVIVKDKKEIDKDRRVLFLKEAANFQNFDKLKIRREYLSFLKSSDFLLGFFEELAIEKVHIDDIDTKDTYAEYSEHLSILKSLLKNYKVLLDRYGYYDKILLPEIYHINFPYLKRFEKIELFLDGYLSNFELELFLKISEKIKFEIIFKTNPYNEKMIERFKSLGFDLKKGFKYTLDLSEKSVIESHKLDTKIDKIELFYSQNSIEQVAYIKKKIYDFMQEGISAQDIVVIVPNESFSLVMNDFDKENIFNFAMGFPFEESLPYRRIEALYRYIDEPNIENGMRIKRYFDEDELQKTLSRLNSLNSIEKIKEFLESFIKDSDSFEEISIFKEEIFNFERLAEELQKSSPKDMLYLFLLRLKERKIDDNRGGKVTVMGVLESRLVGYEGVIIVDFNEDVVPKKSSKELFLSTPIRKKAGLPTHRDRENLQKQYYYEILLGCKRGAISAIRSDDIKPSRFLYELNISNIAEERYEHRKLFDILSSKKSSFSIVNTDEISFEYDFSKVRISSTLLKTYLECKRKYYFKYIKKLSEFQIPTLKYDDREIGIKIHSYLKRLYMDRDFYEDERTLLDTLAGVMEQDTKNNSLLKMQLDIWAEKLKRFAKKEIERFKDGYRVLYTEKGLKSEFEGFEIVGMVDRIDIKDDVLSLLDYKTGTIKMTNARNLEKSVDFQMEFYYLLASGIKRVESVGFYDLNSAEIKDESFLDEKVELLKDRLGLLKDKKQNFAKCEDMKVCRYCPYVILCGREE